MLTILGFVAVIVMTIFIYRTARENNSNAIGWTLAALAVGIGGQVILPLLFGIIYGLVMVLSGETNSAVIQASVMNWVIGISIVSLVISIAGVFLILRRVSVLPDEEPLKPPPPPDFSNQD